MSRGFGQIEENIINVLATLPADDALTVYELCERIYGRHAISPPSRSERESVRRALKGLADKSFRAPGLGTRTVALGYGKNHDRRHLVAWLEPPS